jgi:hypothetical protein
MPPATAITRLPLNPRFASDAPRHGALVVDDFGVKYVGKEHAMHLISILKENYKISEDWTGSKYIGITFDWDYTNRRVHLSMPGYIANALARFAHERPRWLQNSPYPHVVPIYGSKAQYVETEEPSEPLNKDGQKYIQAVTGTLLYYSRAVDPTMLVALNAIAMQQATRTQKTMPGVKQLRLSKLKRDLDILAGTP